MPIALREPFGYQPSYRETPLFQGYGNLQRSLEAPYYGDQVDKAAGFSPYGSIKGGPSLSQALDVVNPDPRKWSTIAPPRPVAGNILGDLGAKPTASTAKLGSFSLNLLYPFESLHDATHKNIGLPDDGGAFQDTGLFGAQGPRVFGVAPIDVLNWQGDLPIKLMERPLALAQTITNRLTGGGPVQVDPNGDAAYPFQKDPAYWQWLHTASDEQLVQQARAVANSTMSYGRNEALFNTLMDRFHGDREAVTGLSSGNKELDWHAKRAAANDAALGARAGWLGGKQDITNPLGGALGTILGTVPFLGIDLQNFVDPITPEQEALWQRLSPKERQTYLGAEGTTLIANNLVGAIPTFGAIGTLGAAAKASTIPTIAQMGRAWSLTLKAANISMAIGLGTTTAAWAVENFAPHQDQRDFGRDVNLVDPLSHSTLGGILNTVGFFGSGTFGAALLVKGGARGLAAIGDRIPGGGLHGLVGAPELPYYSQVYGGAPTADALFRLAGVPKTSSEFAFKNSLMSFMVNAATREGERVYRMAIAGEPIGNEAIDALGPAERIAWAEQQLARTYGSRQALVGQLIDRFGRARQRASLLPDEDQATLEHFDRQAVRNMGDEASRAHVSQYGADFFGSDRGAIRSRIQSALTALGFQPDMAGFDREFGTHDNLNTLQHWTQLARAVHQLEYSVRDAELAEHVKGSHEQAATLFSQRTLAEQDIEAALPILRGADAAAARAEAVRLISTKHRVAELYALGEFRDPEHVVDPQTADPARLAGHLEAILKQNGAPRFRDLADPNGPTAGEPLNAFHQKLVDEGKWQIGFRAKSWMPEAETFAAALERELSPSEMVMLDRTAFTLKDVPPGVTPEGYVELKAGMKFKRKNWYELKPIYTSDGRFFVVDDGSLSMGQQPATPSATARPSNNPANPRPVDIMDNVDWGTLTDEEKVIVRRFDQPKSSVTMPHRLTESDFQVTGETLKGRNAGAEWPVLKMWNVGDRYLFKARRNPGGPLADLSPARLLAGPTATRLLAYLGLHVAEERPFRLDNVEGTIQKIVDNATPIDLVHLENASPEVVNELVKQHIGDWLTSQHDSNSDSMLLGDDGLVYGVDKGQAYKYVGREGEDQAMLHDFWNFQTSDAADVHLGWYLRSAAESGVALDRQAVEPLIQAIEAMPEDVFLASLEELAIARVADGRFETTRDEFYADMIARKRAIRTAVNAAFRELGYATIEEPGGLKHWPPGAKGLLDLGTPTRLNERPIPLEDLYAYNDANPVDEPNGDAVTKAGVVVQEPDGQVWIINPKNNWQGVAFTWPKGGVDFAAGESLQHAAIREGFEETGLSVRLKAHLVDLPNENGVWTRYYLAERVSGGPEHVESVNEIGQVVLVPAAEAGQYLFQNHVANPRDTHVLDALLGHTADVHQAAETQGLDPSTPEDVVTADPAGEMGYTSHVKLANGSVWRTAWLDANIREAAQIELGNRGIAGRAYDTVFQGWRAWRLLETQKAGLHFRLARDFEMGPGAAEKIELLYIKLLEIQRKTKGGSIQAIAGIDEHFPFIGRYHDDVAAAAKEIFGEGPYLSRKTGKPESIDFNRMIQESFRQSLRLNGTAGFTSWLKSIPGLSQVILPMSDFIYPLLRFHISPLFKGGEYVESAVYNAMRGTQRTGDPFIDALWWKAGAGTGLGILQEEGGADMMLASLSSLATTTSQRGRFSDAAFLYERTDPAEHAKAVAGELAPSSPFKAPDAAANLGDALVGGRGLELPDPVKFPDTYSELTPRRLLREAGTDPTDSAPILELAGGDHTRAQVQRYRDQILGSISMKLVTDPELAMGYGSGLAFLAAMPPGQLERLAEAIPQIHTPVSSKGTSAQFEFMQNAILGGYPAFSGRLSAGDFSLVLHGANEGVVPGVEHTGYKSSTSISEKEQWVGFADAKYGSTAADYAANNNGELLVILKPEKLRDSVTVGTDRINLENDVVALRDQMMTPAAVQAITRLELQRMIVDWHVEHPDLDFREFLTARLQHYFSSTSPFEMAYMNGIGFEDIAAVMLPHDQMGEWSSFVGTYKDHPNAKGLDQVDAVPYNNNFSNADSGYRGAMVANWLDRAGLAELGKVKPEILSHDEALLSLPPPAITMANVKTASWQIENAAGRLGIRASTSYSHIDQVNLEISKLRKRAHGLESGIAGQKSTAKAYSSSGSTLASSADSLRVVGEQLKILEGLRADIKAFYETGRFNGETEATAAQANPELLPAADAWLAEQAALEQRMIVAGVRPGNGETTGFTEISERGGPPTRIPFEPQAPIETRAPTHGVTGRDLADVEDPYKVLESKALLEAYQQRVPHGYSMSAPGIIPATSARPISEAIDTPALRSAIRARAEAKLGQTLTDPVIRAYIRGSVDRIPEHYQFHGNGVPPKGVDDLVITISDGSGQPYGNLTLPELTELWQQYGFPADFRARAEAAGFSADRAGQLEGASDRLLHGPGPTPEGRFYFYGYNEAIGTGAFEQTPLGRDYVDPEAARAFDAQLAYSFDPAGKSYVTLENGEAYYRAAVEEHPHAKGGTEVSYHRPGEPNVWSYRLVPGAGEFWDVRVTHANRGDLFPLLRDVFDRTRDQPVVRLRLANTDEVDAFERLYVRGEVPPHILAVDQIGDPLDAFRIVGDFSTPELVNLLPEPPAADFSEIKGTPESIHARLVAQWRTMGRGGRRAADALMNPIPFKQVSMDRLAFHVARRTFAPAVIAENPRAAGVFAELKVPKDEWANFLLEDRALLSRWKESGARADWEAMVLHSSKYTGRAEYEATRKGLDELYTSPDFETMLETWRAVVKTAQDEAYQVHFFSQYRSTFERTINHPIFGLYPASWAFKAAKEWYRFLYQNTTLGFRAGMVPAAVMKQLTQAQAVAWAQSNPEDLDKFWQSGPVSSSAFIFNLLMPGDWSSLPFPFSRAIRDVARGKGDPVTLADHLTDIGLRRDIRLLSESAGEFGQLASQTAGQGTAFKGATSSAGQRLPSYARAESIASH